MATKLSRVLMGTFPQLRYEPTAKRIRAIIDQAAVVDTRQAWLIWEPRRITPIYAVPEQDLLCGLAAPALPPAVAEEHPFAVRQGEAPTSLDPGTAFGNHSCAGEELDVVTAAAAFPRAAFRPADPDLAGYVLLDFAAFDWLEDDEEIIGHPRDPFHRIDIRASSAEVQVALDGATLAETNGAQLLYETLLPVRYYIPPADVRLELLRESTMRSVCPYKGQASYWSYPDSAHGRDIAWSYDERFRDAAQIHGLICFFNERIDLRVNGVLQSRPVSPWSRPDGPDAR